MTKDKDNRILWIDVMKGLGILSVVAGHIYGGEISRNIFIFHMPLFFFISGYLFKPTSNYKDYFTKKMVHLIVPYFFFLIPLYIYFMDFPSSNIKEIAIYLIRPFFGGNLLFGYFGVFWFITCLFLTQQLMNYLISKFDSKKVSLLVFGMLIISYLNAFLFPKLWLPWSANVVFAAGPIFYIGYLYKNGKIKIGDMMLLIAGAIVILFSHFYPKNIYIMKDAVYGIPFITLISSIVLTLNIKFISTKLSNYRIPHKVFSELGKASMIIMFLHQPIQMTIQSGYTTNELIRFSIATVLSYLIYLVLTKFKFGRAFLLGSKRDFDFYIDKFRANKKVLESKTV